MTIRPLGGEGYCGDTGIIKEFDNKVFVGLIDVLGHGKNAHDIAIMSKEFLDGNYRNDLVKTMRGLHELLKGTRGAVAGLGLLDLAKGELKYVGVGNITVRKFGSSSVRLISRSGVVGYMMPSPREETMNLYDGDVLVLNTDGVKEHFELEDYPELLTDSAKAVATNIIHRFAKEEDDGACIALRFKV